MASQTNYRKLSRLRTCLTDSKTKTGPKYTINMNVGITPQSLFCEEKRLHAPQRGRLVIWLSPRALITVSFEMGSSIFPP